MTVRATLNEGYLTTTGPSLSAFRRSSYKRWDGECRNEGPADAERGAERSHHPHRPGHRGRRLMRRYWQPAALVDELAGNRPIKPVRLLGEDLVLFRDDTGRYGLIGRACPHRGTDLAYGRLEDGGLRCAFHGWLFDVNGQCLRDAGRAGRLATCAATSGRRPIR